jgi:hypothetical protein
MRFTIAQQRYNQRVLRLSVAYALFLFAAVFLLSRGMVHGPLAYVLGVLPALPVCGFFWMMGRYLIEESDEYLRMLQIRQLLIATGIALTAMTIWGFLEGFALVPHIVAYLWAVVWVGALGIGACINRVVERRRA